MLDFSWRLRREGRQVLLCIHPNEHFHLQIVEEVYERFLFVQSGTVTPPPNYAALLSHPPARAHLGDLLTEQAA